MSNWTQRAGWWLSFILATVALSKIFEASRHLTAGDGWSFVVPLGLWFLVMLGALFALGYDSYLKARQEGKVVHRVVWYDRIHQWLTREQRG